MHEQRKSFLLSYGTWLQIHMQGVMSGVWEDWDTQYVVVAWEQAREDWGMDWENRESNYLT